MAFQIDGFLGGDEEPRIAKAHTCCAPLFALADPPLRNSSKRCPSFTRRSCSHEQLSYFMGGPDGRARHGRGGEHLGSQLRRNGDFDWLRPQ
jgi:hypothetical protein